MSSCSATSIARASVEAAAKLLDSCEAVGIEPVLEVRLVAVREGTIRIECPVRRFVEPGKTLASPDDARHERAAEDTDANPESLTALEQGLLELSQCRTTERVPHDAEPLRTPVDELSQSLPDEALVVDNQHGVHQADLVTGIRRITVVPPPSSLSIEMSAQPL
jgi:hypothetical protein